MTSRFGALLALSLFSTAAYAQLTTTTLYGSVTDASGATVPNAQATATNLETNLTRTAQSNAEGEYRIEFLPVGKYSLAITAPVSRNSSRATSFWN
jgi:hypothetical protein